MTKQSYYDMVYQFHETYNQPRPNTLTLLDKTRAQLRNGLIEEELQELKEAQEDGDIVEIADALGDLVYVVIGEAIEYGIDLDAVMAEIQRSNLSKLDPATGLPIYREDGKVLKGGNFTPPNIAKVLGLE